MDTSSVSLAIRQFCFQCRWENLKRSALPTLDLLGNTTYRPQDRFKGIKALFGIIGEPVRYLGRHVFAGA